MSTRSALAERAIFVTAMIMISEPAYAYIDPGTGAAVTAAILGLVSSIAYTFRKFAYRIKDLFVRKPPAPGATGEGSPIDR